MTRAELHNTPGFHVATLLAGVAHLRSLLKPNKVAMEPTAQIVSGAEVNGYLKAIEALELATSPVRPEEKKKEYQPYAPPAQPQTETQNKP